MNILLINHYAGSPEMGMEFRPYYFAREWVKMGHSVNIIAADYSHLRRENPVVEEDFQAEEIEGINYYWIKTNSYEGNGVKRALTMFKFCFKLWKNVKKIVSGMNPDVVITSSTYPLDTYPAQKIAKKAKCKYIHEAHDLWPLTLVEVGGMSKYHPFVILLGMAEISAYKNSDKVVGLLPNSSEYMLEHGMQSIDKFVCIQNGIVAEDWHNLEELEEPHKSLFKKLHDENKFIVCYLGGHAISNALDVLIEAAYEMKADEDTAFVLIGNGMEKENLIKMKKDASNIYFLPPIKKTQVPLALKETDALYIGAKYCSLYRFGVSINKMYDYMMAAKPIIYGVKGFNNDVEESKCGITIESENPKAIINAVNILKDMSIEERKKMGMRGKEWVTNYYDYNKLAKDFIEVIKSIKA